jgi:hypothetical protein
MTGSPTLLRRLINLTVRHATRISPACRAPWAAAMREEVRNISDDSEALQWALGCLRTCYGERFGIMKPLDSRIARLGVGLWMAFQAISKLFDGSFVLSYKFQLLGVTRFLGLRTEGDDYRRFVPLLDATSTWEPIFSLVASGLYLACVVQFLRRRRSAGFFCGAALLLSSAQWFHNLNMPLFVQAFSPAHLHRDSLILSLTGLLLALMAYDMHSRESPSR